MDRNEKARQEFAEKMKPKVRQICIGIPSDDSVKANFSMAFAAMSFYCGLRQMPLAFCNHKGSLLPRNRNNLVADAKKLDCSHILQIDSDLTFPPHALERLLSHQKPVVGATYARRSQPHDNLAVPLNRQPVQNVSGLVAVDRLPTGLLLIQMEVFDKIKKPYFRFPTMEESDLMPEGRIDGEDYYLCDAIRQAGYDVMLDVELSFDLIHWGEAGWRLKEETADPASPRFEMIELKSSL